MTATLGDRTAPRDEAGYTLADAPPKVLSFFDQSAFWANLGVSLLAFTGAFTVLAPDEAGLPRLSILAGILAMIVGTLLGSLMLGLAAVPGARTGAPSMVLLRGVFGTRLSYIPTVLNIAQLVGWGTFELIVIAQAAERIFGGGPRWVYVLAAGVITTGFALRPLGAIRLLRRYVTIAVVIALVYFYVQLLRRPLPDLTTGSFSQFWIGADAALAVAISWVPMASDYSRHARSARGAFAAGAIGYSTTQILAYLLGLIALAMVAGDPRAAFDPFLAVPFGVWFFAVLVLRETDQSFADTYSTAVSVQNLAPRADRRILALIVGTVSTLLALAFDIGSYDDFLLLIGSIFVPMFAVLFSAYFLRPAGRRFDISEQAPPRYGMVLAWLLGLATYQVISPGGVAGWSDFWSWVRETLHIGTASWMSASVLSFLVAGIAAYAIGRMARKEAG